MSKNVTSPVKANEPESFMEMVNLFNEIQRQVMVKHGNSDLTMALAQVIENEINDELDKLFQSKIIKDLVVDREPKVIVTVVMGGPEKPSLQVTANNDLKATMDILVAKSKQESEAFNERMLKTVNKQLDGDTVAVAVPGPTAAKTMPSVTPLPDYVGKIINRSSVLMTAVGSVRYGGGYIAFIAGENTAGDLQSYLVSGDEDWIALDGGVLTADWYPVGWGDTALEAMVALNKKCEEIFTKLSEDPDDFNELITALEILSSGSLWIDNSIYGQALKGDKFTLRSFDDLVSGSVTDLLWSLSDKASTQEKEYPPFSGAAIDVFHAFATRGVLDIGDVPSKAGFKELINVDLARYFNHGEKAGLTKEGYVLLGKFFVTQSIVENQFKDFWKKLCKIYAK